MNRAKRILIKILFIPIYITVFLSLLSALMLIYAFAHPAPISAIQYISYALSAYSLTTVCVRLPSLHIRIRSAKQNNRYAVMYFSDADLRIKISLYISFTVNITYSVMQLFLGIMNRSVWFYALSVYYLLLSVMRFFLLRGARERKLGQNMLREYRRYRSCGFVLLPMNLVLSTIVSYIVWQNRGFTYHYIMTIAMAAYTFFTFTISVVGTVRYKKYRSPVMSAAKQINLAAALVSMLSLETAMLSAFGEETASDFNFIMTSLTGAAVCITVLALAVYMIVHSSKQIKSSQKGYPQNERKQ